MTNRAQTGNRKRHTGPKYSFLDNEAEEGSESDSETTHKSKPRKSSPTVNQDSGDSETDSSDSENSFIVDDNYFD